MEQYYLAVDIGASSGRHMLGWLENGRLKTQEVYRFENGMEMKNGRLCWDADGLFGHILEGMKRCAALGRIPESMGIDTWGVDFVLLDRDGCRIGDAVGYRDARTAGMDALVYEQIPEQELYARTGIQKQIFNTIFQLEAVKQQEPELLEQAESLLMLPDYFHYLLTGKKAAEYTEATTTQLVSPETLDWDRELIGRLGFPEKLFQKIRMPGTVLGELSESIAEKVGFSCRVVLPASHDTGSAVAAVPSNEENVLYISSGTWSLMGVERRKADCSPESCFRNFTNEGGVNGRFRYLKNIMGLWMIQSVKKELGSAVSFAQLCEMAEKETILSIVDCNDESFLAPESMAEAVRNFCAKTGQQIPQTLGELSRVIYRSLAQCYRSTAQELEEMTGICYPAIHIVGGGSNADYLNRLTAEAAGKRVYAGPAEATAIGNLAVQMIADGVLTDLAQARSCILASGEIRSFKKAAAAVKGEENDRTGTV